MKFQKGDKVKVVECVTYQVLVGKKGIIVALPTEETKPNQDRFRRILHAYSVEFDPEETCGLKIAPLFEFELMKVK